MIDDDLDVDALVERHGLEGAESRLLAALSAVRRRKVQAKRGRS